MATAIELRDGHLTQTGQIHLLSEEFGSIMKEFKKRIHLRKGFQNYLIRARIHFFPNVYQRKVILDIMTWQHDKHCHFAVYNSASSHCTVALRNTLIIQPY